jgi:hypothetical protein
MKKRCLIIRDRSGEKARRPTKFQDLPYRKLGSNEGCLKAEADADTDFLPKNKIVPDQSSAPALIAGATNDPGPGAWPHEYRVQPTGYKFLDFLTNSRPIPLTWLPAYLKFRRNKCLEYLNPSQKYIRI